MEGHTSLLARAGGGEACRCGPTWRPGAGSRSCLNGALAPRQGPRLAQRLACVVAQEAAAVLEAAGPRWLGTKCAADGGQALWPQPGCFERRPGKCQRGSRRRTHAGLSSSHCQSVVSASGLLRLLPRGC